MVQIVVSTLWYGNFSMALYMYSTDYGKLLMVRHGAYCERYLAVIKQSDRMVIFGESVKSFSGEFHRWMTLHTLNCMQNELVIHSDKCWWLMTIYASTIPASRHDILWVYDFLIYLALIIVCLNLFWSCLAYILLVAEHRTPSPCMERTFRNWSEKLSNRDSNSSEQFSQTPRT